MFLLGTPIREQQSYSLIFHIHILYKCATPLGLNYETRNVTQRSGVFGIGSLSHSHSL